MLSTPRKSCARSARCSVAWFLSTTAFAAVWFAALSLASAAEAPVTLAIDAQYPGATIGPDFSGLSYEVTAILPVDGVRYFRPENTKLITLFQTLGLKSLRIGGNTSDRNAVHLPTEADWDSLFGFAQAAGVKVIYCLRLHQGDPAVDVATVKYIMTRYAPLVDSFSIGQEPSAYPVEKIDRRPAGERMGAAVEKFPYTSYRDQWKIFADAIIAAVPEVKFCGPSVHNNADWARRFMEDYGKGHHVALITEHLYPGGSANKLPSAEVGRERMLSGEFFKVYEKLHAGFVPAAQALGLPYRLEEVNSYFNGGAQDASNTFSAALWGLEFMYWWAAHDAIGLNFHTGDRVSMNGEYQPSRYATFTSMPDGFEIRPLAYAFKAFDLGAHGQLARLTIENSAALNVSAYAVVAADRTATVTIINKEHGAMARDAVVTLSTAGAKWLHAQAITLTAPDGNVAARTGLMLGDATIEKGGSWSGTWRALPAPAADGSVKIKVSAASAMLVRLSN